MTKLNILNVRKQLETLIAVVDVFDKYGDCPAVRAELGRLRFLARATLRKREKTGTRKDLYVEVKS